MSEAIAVQGDQVRIRVHAQPGAKHTEATGLHGDAIKVRVRAPPVEGRANAELINFLSERLAVAKSQVELIRGATSRSKLFLITGLSDFSADEVQRLLLK